MSDDARRVFWSRTQRLTLALLMAWLVVSVGVPWFARDLDRVRVFGFPLGYWFAAEGALLLFLLIIVIYVVAMERLEARYLQDVVQAGGADEETGPGSA